MWSPGEVCVVISDRFSWKFLVGYVLAMTLLPMGVLRARVPALQACTTHTVSGGPRVRTHSSIYTDSLFPTPHEAVCGITTCSHSSSPLTQRPTICLSWASVQLNSQHQSQTNKLLLWWVLYPKPEGLRTALFWHHTFYWRSSQPLASRRPISSPWSFQGR